MGRAGLDLDRLAEIRRRVAIPLVLHGGTGIAADALRQAIALGVAKVNYGTYLKQRYLDAVRTALGQDATDPHHRLGIGGPEDILVAGRRAVRDAVLERIGLLGCCGHGNSVVASTRQIQLYSLATCQTVIWGLSMDVVMRMPDLSTVDETVTLIRWLAEVGQVIQRGDPLLEVETDKAILVVESAVAGTLQAIAVPAGSEVAMGQPIATFDAGEKGPARSGETPVTDTPSGPIAGAAGVTPGGAELAATRQPEPVVTTPASGDRRSFFAQESSGRGDRPRSASEAKAAYRRNIPREFLMDLYRRMVMIREFEEGVKFLFLEGSMPGTIHQCQGQEATAVGVCAALEEGDFITSTFRGHGHALAKGLTPEELLFELFGAVTGCCRGKGGSMHVGNMAKGMVPGIAIVGGGVPLAAGMALTFKMRKEPSGRRLLLRRRRDRRGGVP